jgi:hypothetical protein
MSLCSYCANAPTIKKSHVVPAFFGSYIKDNSPHRFMLNTWERKPEQDLHTGPYLCALCDNKLFSSWENFFIQQVWPNLLSAKAKWTHERSLKFLVSVGYRYALHFLATSPIPAHRAYSRFVRDLTAAALRDISQIGTSLYLYPYVHRPIIKDCAFQPGVNHLLSLGVHGEALPREAGLPNAMVVMFPKILLLICDGDLRTFPGNELRSPQALLLGRPFDALHANTDMPLFLKVVLNRWIGQGQAHQKSLGRWKLTYGVDKLRNPLKAVYIATEQDRDLLMWQRVNCR